MSSKNNNNITVYIVTSIISSIALYPLLPKLDEIILAYTALELSGVQKISIVVLFFTIVFTTVSLVLNNVQQQQARSSTTTATRRSAASSSVHAMTATPKQEYPVQEIDAAASDTEKFKCLFPVIKKDILSYIQTENELYTEGITWIDTMMEYSVPGGKLNRGTMVLAVNRCMASSYQKEFTTIDIAKAAIAGWTIELLQAFFLVADDIMDDSITRRGQPCWYKLPNVKLIAINDSFLLESFVYTVLKQHFGTEIYYYDLIELLLDVTQKTEIGQLLDLTSQSMDVTTNKNSKIDLSRFTMDRYKSIVKYKTAFYSFYLPIAMGMIMAGIPYDTNSIEYQQARTICCIMGEYFQIQDDYLDCFGTPEMIGKIGTDIQDKKCSWLVVQALLLCNDKQRKVLQDNYGIWDDKKVQTIKQLYKELQLETIFLQYEEESYRTIQKELEQLSPIVPKEVYQIFLDKIYKRSK